ncbi:hypothetical protein [Alistipes sp. cv1]|uniref:hypothetical protein n=1 Tax=Alistipes sp. cv1 TaxID=1622071 RepID=UPI000C755E29|nr:hypothetical protein [Alistipes sp. cv1]
MKKIILLMLFGLSCMAGHAQSGELYFCLTPIEETDYKKWTEGIYLEKDDDNFSNPLYKSKGYFFNLKSISRNIDIHFAHINYNTSEMVKRNMTPQWNSTMEIKTTGADIASYHSVYNLDTFFKAYSREQLMDWFLSLDIHNKKIYFFDQRDIAKGKITLIQVKFLGSSTRDNLTFSE